MSGVVYLLAGADGEYEDYREWTVAAYSTREAAEARLASIKALRDGLARAAKVTGKSIYGLPAEWIKEHRRYAGDDEFDVSASYEIVEIPLDPPMPEGPK